MFLKTKNGFFISDEMEKEIIKKYSRHPLIDIYNTPLNYQYAHALLNEKSLTWKLLNKGVLTQISDSGDMTAWQKEAVNEVRKKYGNDINGLIRFANKVEKLHRAQGGVYGNSIVREAYMLGIIHSPK